MHGGLITPLYCAWKLTSTKIFNVCNPNMSHGRLYNEIINIFSDQATFRRDQYTDWKENGAEWPYWWQALTFQTAGKL